MQNKNNINQMHMIYYIYHHIVLPIYSMMLVYTVTVP